MLSHPMKKEELWGVCTEGGILNTQKIRARIIASSVGKYLTMGKLLLSGAVLRYGGRIRGFNDFFSFPFDISQPMPKTAADELVSIVNFLNSQKIEYWLADGTLLGLVRDGKLIDHDTDLDFYLTDPNSIAKISEYLEIREYKVGRFLSRRGRPLQIAFYSQSQLVIDFLIWDKRPDGDYCWTAPEIRGVRLQASSFFDSAEYLVWNETQIRTFSNHIGWLELVYGETWSIPEKKKSDWTKSVGDLH